jgi:DNA primase catalytic subunit
VKLLAKDVVELAISIIKVLKLQHRSTEYLALYLLIKQLPEEYPEELLNQAEGISNYARNAATDALSKLMGDIEKWRDRKEDVAEAIHYVYVADILYRYAYFPGLRNKNPVFADHTIERKFIEQYDKTIKKS